MSLRLLRSRKIAPISQVLVNRRQLDAKTVQDYFNSLGPIRQKTSVLQISLEVMEPTFGTRAGFKLRARLFFVIGRGIGSIPVTFTENGAAIATVRTDGQGFAVADVIVSTPGKYIYQAYVGEFVTAAKSSTITVDAVQVQVSSTANTGFTLDGSTFGTPAGIMIAFYAGKEYLYVFPGKAGTSSLEYVLVDTGQIFPNRADGGVSFSRGYHLQVQAKYSGTAPLPPPPPAIPPTTQYSVSIEVLGQSYSADTDKFTVTIRMVTSGGAKPPLTYRIAWGDGLTETVSTSELAVSRSHIYSQGVYTISVAVIDSTNSAAQTSTQITLTRPATAPPAAPLKISSFTATGTDPYTGDFQYDPSTGKYEVFLRCDWQGGEGPEWHVFWNFGDGTSLQGSVSSQNPLTQYHNYPPGGYTASIQITDSKGQSVTGTVSFTLQPVSEPAPEQPGDPGYYAYVTLLRVSPRMSMVRRQLLATINRQRRKR